MLAFTVRWPCIESGSWPVHEVAKHSRFGLGLEQGAPGIDDCSDAGVVWIHDVGHVHPVKAYCLRKSGEGQLAAAYTTCKFKSVQVEQFEVDVETRKSAGEFAKGVRDVEVEASVYILTCYSMSKSRLYDLFDAVMK